VVAQTVAPGAPANPFEAGGSAALDRSLECLTLAVYHEARSEAEDGQRAVAQVVLNRVRHPAFPNSVCGVVFQGSTRRTGCQFSFTCDGSLGGGREPGAWGRARSIALDALSGSVFAPVGHATHYHTTAILPWWAPSLTRAVTVGAHVFYRWRGEWGHPLAFRQAYAGREPGGEPVSDAPAEEEPARSPARLAYAKVAEAPVTVHRGAVPTTATPPVVRVHRADTAVTVHVATPEPEQPILTSARPLPAGDR
jgi:hypothetical protein